MVSHIVTKNVTQSVLQNARPELSFASIITTFCVLRETLLVMQVSLWLFLSWMRVFMVSTMSVIEVYSPGSGLYVDVDLKSFFVKKLEISHRYDLVH